MADLRITPGSQAVTPAQPAARTEAVKAAQRAFFNTALVQAQTQAAASRTAPSVPSVAAQPVLRATISASAETPERILRPGSLLDIKV